MGASRGVRICIADHLDPLFMFSDPDLGGGGCPLPPLPLFSHEGVTPPPMGQACRGVPPSPIGPGTRPLTKNGMPAGFVSSSCFHTKQGIRFWKSRQVFADNGGRGCPPPPSPLFFSKGVTHPTMRQGGWGVPPHGSRELPKDPGKDPGKTGKVLRSFFQVPAVYNPVGSMTV